MLDFDAFKAIHRSSEDGHRSSHAMQRGVLSPKEVFPCRVELTYICGLPIFRVPTFAEQLACMFMGR
jgi:hypothetical protein